MSKVTVKMNSAGARALLRSPEVQADLRRRAEAIATAAGEGNEVAVSTGTGRARAAVYTATFEAKKSEAEDRTLTQAIDAGRG